MAEKVLLTVGEAAQRRGIGRSKCYQMVLAGEPASVKLGRRRLVPARALNELVDRLLAQDGGMMGIAHTPSLQENIEAYGGKKESQDPAKSHPALAPIEEELREAEARLDAAQVAYAQALADRIALERLLERQGGRLNEAEAKAALDAATARFEEAERALKEALLRVGVLRRKRTLKLREIGRL